MKVLSLKLSVLVFLIICFSISSKAETIVASSIEWLTVSSNIVAVGKIISVEKSKGDGSVIYETYLFKPSEIIKGTKHKQNFNFTIRTFSTEPVFGRLIGKNDEVLIFLSENEKAGEKFLENKLIPTNTQLPLSIINLDQPNKYIINLDFKVLKNKDDILKICRKTDEAQTEYLKQNPTDSIKRFYLEVPMGTEAFGSLYGGSACYLFVPNFMSPKAKETIY